MVPTGSSSLGLDNIIMRSTINKPTIIDELLGVDLQSMVEEPVTVTTLHLLHGLRYPNRQLIILMGYSIRVISKDSML